MFYLHNEIQSRLFDPGCVYQFCSDISGSRIKAIVTGFGYTFYKIPGTRLIGLQPNPEYTAILIIRSRNRNDDFFVEIVVKLDKGFVV